MVEAYRGGELLAEVVRSGFVEGFHRGSAVVLGPDGNPRAAIGDVTGQLFPRSSNKPLQSIGALRTGLDFADPADLAIGSASHRGEPFHIARVSAILQRSGLTAQDLGCPAALPSDDDARLAILASGGGPTRLHMNCSGKHAAMLSTCVTAGLSTKDYLDEGHPLQQANRAVVAEFTGEEITISGRDGCGAPLFAVSLTGLAPIPYRMPYAGRLVTLIITMAMHAFFGIAIMSQSGLMVAEWFGAMGRTWGDDPMRDQYVGGGIAWSIGEIPTVITAIVVAIQWSSSDEKQQKRRDRHADRTGDAELEAYNARLAKLAERDSRR